MVDSVPGTTVSTVDIAVGSVTRGTLETANDHDWYRLTLSAGQTYRFATSFGGTSSIDTLLTLRDVNGQALATDDDGGPGQYSLLLYSVAAGGTYFLDVGSFGESSSGGFTLSVSSTASPPGDVIAADTSTSSSIAIGATSSSRIDAVGDHDWFRVNLVAGQAYQIRTNATGDTGDPDTTISVRSQSGAELAFNDDGDIGTYSLLRFTAPSTGAYYLDIGTYGDAETGAYNLSVVEATPLTVWTNDQIAQQLVSGYWGGVQHPFPVAAGGTLTINLSGVADAVQAITRRALGLWTDVTGIVFAETLGSAQIMFDDLTAGAGTSSTRGADGKTVSSRINIGPEWTNNYGLDVSSYSSQAVAHELGHALGLGHSGNYNGEAAFPADALYLNDHWGTSIMSYFSQTQNSYSVGLGYTRQFQVTPTVADGIAANILYGPVTTTRTGDTRYGFNTNAGRVEYDATINPAGGYTVFDSGGTDTLDYSGFAQNQVVNLDAETFSSVGGKVANVSIARAAMIENAVGGAGNDVLMGNGATNLLQGGAGADTLMGGGGEDRLEGGIGSDTYLVDSPGDVVIEANGGGSADIVYAVANYILPSDAEIENFAAAQGSSTVGLSLTGNQYGQAIAGTYGNDVIDGGGATINGGDILIGLFGDDLYYVDALSALLIENPSEGTDTAIIRASASGFVLNAASGYVEVLSAAAGNAAINITGNALSQTINGNDGANILSTGSGAPDTLNGGLGDDIYRLYGGPDVVIDTGGIDTIYTSGTFRLTGAAAIEVISTALQASTNEINLTGNDTAQTIIGNYGANTLDGRGGNDTLIGLEGFDIYAFTSPLGTDNVDTLVGFVSGTDKIGLAANVFANVVPSVGRGSDFVLGTSATAADQRLIYDQATGRLFYDADANGSGAQILFAILGTGTVLSANDFAIILPVGSV